MKGGRTCAPIFGVDQLRYSTAILRDWNVHTCQNLHTICHGMFLQILRVWRIMRLFFSRDVYNICSFSVSREGPLLFDERLLLTLPIMSSSLIGNTLGDASLPPPKSLSSSEFGGCWVDALTQTPVAVDCSKILKSVSEPSKPFVLKTLAWTFAYKKNNK